MNAARVDTACRMIGVLLVPKFIPNGNANRDVDYRSFHTKFFLTFELDTRDNHYRQSGCCGFNRRVSESDAAEIITA